MFRKSLKETQKKLFADDTLKIKEDVERYLKEEAEKKYLEFDQTIAARRAAEEEELEKKGKKRRREEPEPEEVEEPRPNFGMKRKKKKKRKARDWGNG